MSIFDAMPHEEYSEFKALEVLLVEGAGLRQIHTFLNSCCFLVMSSVASREDLNQILAITCPRLHRFELFLQLDSIGMDAPLSELEALAAQAPNDVRESVEYGYLCGVIGYRMLNEII